jgi:hypothetical protein
MIELLQTYSKETFALVAVCFGFMMNRIFRLRPQLFYSVRHSSNYVVDQPLLDSEGKVLLQKQMVSTASIVSENAGLRAAKSVEFTFNWKPPIYTVFPGRAFDAEDTSMGRWSIKLDSLAPGEVFGIEIMSINQELPYLTAMRSEDAAGKLITMVPQRQFPAWFNRSVVALVILGLTAALYLIALLVEWLAS